MTNNFGLIDLLNENDPENEDDSPNIFQNSPYYDNERFSSFLSRNSSFKNLLLNCQSINSKFSELKIYIESNTSQIHAICLQETWLSDNSDLSLLQLDEYNLISKGKVASIHGGVAIYLKE